MHVHSKVNMYVFFYILKIHKHSDASLKIEYGFGCFDFILGMTT